MDILEIKNSFDEYKDYVIDIPNRYFVSIDSIILDKDIPENIRKDELYCQLIKNSTECYKYFKNVDSELLMRIIKINGLILKYLEDDLQTEEICKEAIKSKYGSFKHVINKTEEMCWFALECNDYNIKYIEEPSYEMILYSVSKCSSNIAYVKNQPIDLVYKALRENPSMIYFIRELNFDICLFVVKLEGGTLYHINENGKIPSYLTQDEYDILCNEALINNPYEAFGCIINPSYELCLKYISEYGDLIDNIQNPSDEIILLAIKTYPDAISCYEGDDYFFFDRAIDINPKIIKFIGDLDEELVAKALMKDHTLFKNMFNTLKTDEINKLAVRLDSENIKYVHNYPDPTFT